jgi:predicted ABC-type ATPase
MNNFRLQINNVDSDAHNIIKDIITARTRELIHQKLNDIVGPKIYDNMLLARKIYCETYSLIYWGDNYEQSWK